MVMLLPCQHLFRCDQFEAGCYGPVDNGTVVAKDLAAMDTANTQWLFQGFPSFRHKTYEVPS